VAGLLQRVEHASELLVEVGDERVVLRPVHLYGVRGAGVGGEPLVAERVLAADGVLVRVGRQEVGRNRDLLGRVLLDERLRALARVVRRVEGGVDERRACRRSGGPRGRRWRRRR
jgi:hypothetical protein